ncbi:hypothetical protein PGAL8A_00194800 [Plasmodium gallinaceum]|uniref:Fam-b protein n=1 Tax=Plasmodium gallinaceum TaxID=5849 RepID=A0A1J1GQ33_PLAGA|nr:hypothetical protein PGAL8A_00194800 [Plasmodium gallinaceum]CRG94552.1 hypothetical protein PGAL8A_00194800 [Plasmodium gallinaceum]
MKSGLFWIVILNICFSLFGVSYEEDIGTESNKLDSNLIDSSFYSNLRNANKNEEMVYELENLDLGENEYDTEEINLEIKNEILSNPPENTEIHNLKGPRGGDPTISHILNNPTLKGFEGRLFIQRRKLLNMKKKLDEIHKLLSERMNEFCSHLHKRNHNYTDNIREEEIHEISYKNNSEYIKMLLYTKKILEFLKSSKLDEKIYKSYYYPIIQKNIGVQRYIKNLVNNSMDTIDFIYKKKGFVGDIEANIKSKSSSDLEKYLKSKEFSGSVMNTLYDVDISDDGIFSTTKAKITLGILGCILVGGGIAFAFYYKKMMFKN